MTAKKTPALRDWREQRNNRRVSIDDERRRAQKAEFIRALKITGAVRQTCDALGVSRASIYRWKEDDEQFREQWIEARFSAKDNLIEMLEDAAIERALHTSDGLLKFLLQHLYPERYREEQLIEHKGKMLIWDASKPAPKPEGMSEDGQNSDAR